MQSIVKKTIAMLLAVCFVLGGAVTTLAQTTLPYSSNTVIMVKHPGVGNDASPAIQAAISKAKRVKGPVTIAFEQDKQYEVWPETAYHTTGYYISNSATRSENPNGERWSAILLKDMRDVTIEGNNALLMIHGVMTPVLVDNSENITFQDFNLDYARPTVSEFTVTEKTSSYVKVKIHEDTLYQLKDNNRDGKNEQILWLGEQKKSDSSQRYWSSYATLMQELDPNNETLRRIGFYSWGSNITDEGNNILKLGVSNSPFKEGFTYQVRDGIRTQVGTFIHKSKNVSFINSKFHYMHGLGIVGQYSENLTFDRIVCAPRVETGRTCAGFADFMQISGCKGEVVVTNSFFSGNHDDTFNIHGTHLRIVERDNTNQKIKVRFMQNQSWGFQAFEVGDEIEFINGSSLVPYQKNTVKSFSRINDTDIELTLEEPLPENIGLNYDAVENITWTPNVTIKNNISEFVPTRAVLCTTRGKVLIEGNTFKKQGMAAILLEDDARGWFESGLINDMTIRNNIFEDCTSPQIHSNPQVASIDPTKPVHSNISIVGNTFTGQAVNIEAISTKNLLIEQNQFPQAGGNISLNGCNGFEVKDNQNFVKLSTQNSVNEKSFASLKVDGIVEGQDISRTGMTATAHNEWPGDGGGNPPNPASNVLDGNTSTFWSTDWDNPPTDNIYIEIDLNGKKQFNQLTYLPRTDTPYARILKYEIYANDENNVYQKIAEGNWANTYDLKQANFNMLETDKIKLIVVETSKSWDGKNVVMGAEISFKAAKSIIADNMPIGKKLKLNLSATGLTGMPADLSEATFAYATSNSAVAEVADDGTITTKGQGSANITVTVTAYNVTLHKTVTINVSNEKYVTASKIKINELPVELGQTIQLSAIVEPADAEADVRWSVQPLSSSNSINATIDENTGLLKAKDDGRLLITAYSANDPTVKDTVTVFLGKENSKWTWLRENPASWSIDESNRLKLTIEPGGIWASVTAKNTLITPASTDDYELVSKMKFKPKEDYSEAGIVMYVDDNNFVVLTRKSHPGYRPGQRNIFSMIARVGGTPWESPSSSVVNDDMAEECYLKLKKEGNSYSGYYSADGQTWNTIYQNKTANLGARPKAGIMGYGPAGEDAVIYESLKIDNNLLSFEDLNPDIGVQNAQITAISPAKPTKTLIGTAFKDVKLALKVNVTWNNKSNETLPVTWSDENYKADEVGTYQLNGILTGVQASDIQGDLKPTINVIVLANKAALDAVVKQANAKLKDAYTVDTWTSFRTTLEEITTMVQADDAVTQEAVNDATKTLETAINRLKLRGTFATLETLITQANTIINNCAERLYSDDTAQENRKNGFYSAEKYNDLSERVQAAKVFAGEIKDVVPLGLETPAAKTPAAKTPTAETPAAEVTPAAEILAAEILAAEIPAAEILAAEIPAAEIPAAEIPAAKTPAAETPAAKTPAAEISAAEISAAEILVEKVPTEKTQMLSNTVDDFLTEEEKIAVAEQIATLAAAAEEFEESKSIVSVELLNKTLADAQDLVVTSFTPESWIVLQDVITKAKKLIDTDIYTANELMHVENELSNALEGLKQQFTVRLINTVGGTIISSPENYVEKDKDITFTVVTEEGYRLISFTVNSVEAKLTDSKYTLTDVQRNVTAIAKFMRVVKSDTNKNNISIEDTNETMLPPDVVMTIKEKTDEEVGAIVIKNVQPKLAFDIMLKDGSGKTVQPNGFVKVIIELPMQFYTDAQAEKLGVYFVDGTRVEDKNARCIQINGKWYIEFATDHFSTYVVALKHDSPKSTGVSSSKDDFYKIWDDVVARLNNATTGDKIIVRINTESNIPAKVIDALAGKDITLVIDNGIKEIILYGVKVKKTEADRIYFTFVDLAKLTDEIEVSGTTDVNPETGGVIIEMPLVSPSIAENTVKQHGAITLDEQKKDDDTAIIANTGEVIEAANRTPWKIIIIGIVAVAGGVVGLLFYRKRNSMED